MILVDTAIWIDHLHRPEPALRALLEDSMVCTHPMVIGELALGSMRQRSQTLSFLVGLDSLPTAGHEEVLHLVEAHQLHGRGLSLVDAHLLASLRLSRATTLWTRDRRLRAAAERLDVAADLD